MTPKRLHIVSFDVPYPVNYGGVIDVFFKVKALSEMGVQIILHCYHYGREKAQELEELCVEVNYYKRDMSPFRLFSKTPFIINTRSSEALISRLKEDNYPILFEGLHTSYPAKYLNKKRLFLRNHNIESDYYKALADGEKSMFKRFYFKWESKKLLAFEEKLVEGLNKVICISEPDQKYFKNKYSFGEMVSAFHQADSVKLPSGNGSYCLYHGNLSVGENDKAAKFLVKEVFNDLPVRLIIAGNSPSEDLVKLCSECPNVDLKENVSTDEIMTLMNGAHINVLPTFQATGIKLKLLLCLFKGRFVVANDPMVKGTGLESLVSLANSRHEFKTMITELMHQDWLSTEQKRESILSRFSNQVGASDLVEIIFGK